jgi:tetratricopeptide (TPR) repeat protein
MSYLYKLIGSICLASIIFLIPCYSDVEDFELFYPGNRANYYEVQCVTSSGAGKDIPKDELDKFIDDANSNYFISMVSNQTKKDLKIKKINDETANHILDVSTHIKKSAYSQLTEEFTKAIDLEPKYPFAYKYRGICEYKSEYYEKAIADFSKAIELEPDEYSFYEERAISYSLMKIYKSALSDYDKAIELKTPNACSYYNRGCIYSIFAQYDKAIHDFTKALEISLDKSKNLTRLELSSRSYRNLKWTINYESQYINPLREYYCRGLVYFHIQQYKEAINDFEKVIKLEPQYTNAYFYLGNIYKDMNNDDKSIYYFSKTIDVDNNNLNAYLNRGLVYDKMSKKKQACADFKKACELGNCEKYNQAKASGDCE